MDSSNREKLDELFRAHFERIARVIGRVIHDQARAEELAVEVFLKWKRQSKIQKELAEGWLYRGTVRAALDENRRKSRWIRIEGMLSFFGEGPRSPQQLYMAEVER